MKIEKKGIIKILSVLQIIILIIILFEMGTRRSFKYDEIMIAVLFGITICRNSLNNFKYNWPQLKKLYILLLLNIFFFWIELF